MIMFKCDNQWSNRAEKLFFKVQIANVFGFVVLLISITTIQFYMKAAIDRQYINQMGTVVF